MTKPVAEMTREQYIAYRKTRDLYQKTRKDRPIKTVDPWRCPTCGGRLKLPVCLKCEGNLPDDI